jgi:hypothetical protein
MKKWLSSGGTCFLSVVRKTNLPEEPTEFELNHIRNDVSGMKEKRKRLSNVSWFMKCLAEPIARLGNKEEKVQCSRETWVDLVKNFRKRFRVEIGLPTTLQSVSSRRQTNRTAVQA